MIDEIATTDVKTEEEIAQDYSAMQDSVNLIDEMRTNPPVDMTDEEVADCISRNVEHLELMVAKDYWTNEDMTAVNAAIGD
ncbi:putative F-box and FNIP repeat-containing protein [Methylophilales phage Venkman EXVC282S]|nr:putative F-box and FNIP repeat-containing protein [Methylophilales phage Venkman EXVC282S]